MMSNYLFSLFVLILFVTISSMVYILITTSLSEIKIPNPTGSHSNSETVHLGLWHSEVDNVISYHLDHNSKLDACRYSAILAAVFIILFIFSRSIRKNYSRNMDLVHKYAPPITSLFSFILWVTATILWYSIMKDNDLHLKKLNYTWKFTSNYYLMISICIMLFIIGFVEIILMRKIDISTKYTE